MVETIDTIAGEFASVVSVTGREDGSVCTTDRAVIVRVGERPVPPHAGAVRAISEIP